MIIGKRHTPNRCSFTVRIYKLGFETQGSMEFITLKPLVAPSLRLGATAQGLRVINSVDPCVLKSNYYVVSYHHS